MLRLMMATTSRNLSRNLTRATKPKLLSEKDAARVGISSAPNSGRPKVRAQSTQPPPKSTTTSGAAAPRKTTSSSSAGNVNLRRNIRRTGGSASSDGGLSTSFQKLSVNDKSLTGKRQQTTSAGSRGACRSIEDVARRILTKKSKNIVVMAGAGISTPSGIPDFRTPGSGLYDNLQQYNIPYPEAIFDINYFHGNPKPFFTLAKELYPSGKYRPNYVHYFVRMLYDKGLLLRMYTQNIDGLERLAGIPGEKLVEAHGTFTTCTCTRCGMLHEGEDVKVTIFADKIPRCKRASCKGLVKPNIVFFGEDLPKRFFYYLKDMPQCDLLIIMGTSLEVYPFAGIVDSVRIYIPRLLINREAVGPFVRPMSGRNDLAVTGDLVECVQKFARVLGWRKDMEDMIKENEARLDEMWKASEEQQEQNKDQTEASQSETSSATNTTNQKPGTNSNASPQRLTNLHREQNNSNGRKFHTESLSRVNSVSRAQSSISKPKVTLPKLNNGRRDTKSAYRVNRTAVASDSSDTSSWTSSSDDSDSDS